MIVTFNYAEAGITDPRPTFLFLYYNKEKKLMEGLNLNYINPTKIKKLFQVIQFKKGKLDEDENLLSLKENYFRIQISNPKKRSPLSTKRFYSDVVSSDNTFPRAYRSYKIPKLSALKLANIKLEMVT
tara:strand:+ start:236 stop:619 length:384 start_codon:yes stop_codon:yes gene_type:complete